MLAATLVQAAAFSAWFVLLRELTDAAARGQGKTAATAGVLLGLAVGGERLAASVHARLAAGLQERTGRWIKDRLAQMLSGLPGIEHLERPDLLRRVELVWDDPAIFSFCLSALTGALLIGLRIAATLGLLAAVHPFLLLLPAFAAGSVALGVRAARLRERAREAGAEARRRAGDLFDLATSVGSGRELRTFGLEAEILEHHRREWDYICRTRGRAELQGAVLESAGWLPVALAYVGGVALLTLEAVAGRASLGDIVMTLGLAAQISMQFTLASGAAGRIVEILAALGRYVWLTEYAGTAMPEIEDPGRAPERLRHGIVLDDISFRYPGTDVDVLSGVSLTIGAGTTVAVVGENGAGKTTLVKLLCRLYEPTGGRIIVDGTDLGRIDAAEWRSRLSAGFQDFLRLEVLARESVGCGDLPRIDDEGSVLEALERAGGADVVPVLPLGLETPVGKSFDDGVELSLGQWQKLALGRAMMREPLLLILDEPTSSLDPAAEHALFERYSEAARRQALGSGAITLLVSHRFSTVRSADLVVVLGDGRIVEAGSHEELMAKGEVYAELYELQARAYR